MGCLLCETHHCKAALHLLTLTAAHELSCTPCSPRRRKGAVFYLTSRPSDLNVLRAAAVGGLGAVGFAVSKLDAGFSEFFADTIVKVQRRHNRSRCLPVLAPLASPHMAQQTPSEYVHQSGRVYHRLRCTLPSESCSAPLKSLAMSAGFQQGRLRVRDVQDRRHQGGRQSSQGAPRTLGTTCR